jgi:hypothetical protein
MSVIVVAPGRGRTGIAARRVSKSSICANIENISKNKYVPKYDWRRCTASVRLFQRTPQTGERRLNCPGSFGLKAGVLAVAQVSSGYE